MLTRLRSRGSAAARHPPPENADDAANPAGTVAASQRPVLGDVSNKRQSQKDAVGGKAAKKIAGVSKRLKKSSVAPGDVQAPVPSGGVHPGDGATAQTESRVDLEEPSDTGVETATHRPSKGRSNSTAAARRETRASSRGNVNAGKRSGAELDEEARQSKRAKVTDCVDDKNSHDVSQERSRSRSRAQDHRPDKKEAGGREDEEEPQPRNLHHEYIVPPDFRLQRYSYNGVNHTVGIAPHDVDDKDNILQVVPYVTDLFQHLFRAEARSCPEMYMHNQADINAKMRAILADWLVEVHMKFRLVPETLYLCINIIDRYCSHVSVARSKLQLVGVTALLIACKYEEIYPPEVRDCVYITDRAYNRQEVLDMEQDMLQRLRFKITVPTAYPFLLRFLNMTKAPQIARHAANYYMERTLQEHDLLQYKPSIVAAACVILALNNPDVLNETGNVCPGLPKILLEYTGFERAVLLDCANLTATKVGEEPVTASRRQLVAVKRKYDNKKCHHVSISLRRPCVNHVLATREEHAAGGDHV